MMEKYVISKFKNDFFLKNNLFILSIWKLTLGYGNMMEPWALGFLKHPHVGITFKHMSFAEGKFTGYKVPSNYT